MNPYLNFVTETARLLREAKSAQLGGFPLPPQPKVDPGAPRVLVFSPHPDDEVIIGGLALRLLRELRWNAINVAVTQGSNKARQPERWKELTHCCGYIGFGLVQTRENGLEGINLKTRKQSPADWGRSVDRITAILNEHKPRAVLFPHAEDWNSTHIGTHHLVVDALATLGGSFTCYTVETEFWGPMDDPNLMVESSEQDLVDLITALTFHVGEVQRNPYHLRLPAWMIDNVRRGGELVGGQGGAAPEFTFATLYRLRRWRNSQFEKVYDGGRFLSCQQSPSGLFN
jgi:LmbE family N-acetylglucosaminyl deacetylase